MIICEECNEVIVGEMVESYNGPIHKGGCPENMRFSGQLDPFGQRVTVDRKTIDLSNQQMDAAQRLAKAIFSMDEEITAEKILLMWPTDTVELKISGPKPTKTKLEVYLRTTAFIKDMASRGVKLDEMKQQLSSAQIALVQMIKNPEGRKLSTILRRAKVSQYVFDGWMKQPVFRKYVTAIIGDTTNQALLLSEVSLSQKALDGDMNAIKFLYEFKDKYNPAKDNNAADAMEFVRTVLAVVQRVVGKMDGGAEALSEIKQGIEMEQTANGIGRS